jgi:histidinol-phosphatase (PHP family)
VAVSDEPRVDTAHPLPPDDHVHTQWSWDTEVGSMVDTCARAVELGLPSLSFTEHVDATSWRVVPGVHDDLPPEWNRYISGDVFTPPALDLDGYLACIDECRDRFPSLRIRSGAELSEPHWHSDYVADFLQRSGVERVLASLHSSPTPVEALHHDSPDPAHVELSAKYDVEPPETVVRDYLAEIVRMIEGFDGFEVLAHIDYPLRYWPHAQTPFDPFRFEDEFRHALGVLARSGRVLELNTKLPMRPQIVRWWHDVGGERLSFGSDAHQPTRLARGFRDAMQVADATGFRPGRDPFDFWRRA